MNVWQTVFLGFVQGLTEFLPVSSSGHLILTRQLFGWEGGSLLFDIFLHVGSLGAVVWVLRKDILALFRRPWKKLGLLVFATVPAALLGFLLSDVIDGTFGSGRFLWMTFALTGVLLLSTERLCKRNVVLPIGGKQAAFMGLAQACALLPGLSRSGSTVFGGVAAGGDREEVAKFSFLMSVPVILGSAAVGAVGLVSGGGWTLTVGWWEMLCGMAAAFVGGLIAVRAMLKIVVRAHYKPLAFYLFAVSVLSLTLTLMGR